MKTRNFKLTILGGFTLIAILAISAWGCKKDDNTTPSKVYASDATVSGKTYSQWAAEWWKWNLQFDCAHFPIRDVDGSLENQNQSGSVFLLAGKRGNTLSVTVPSGKTIFLPLITFESDYPCASDTSAHPAPGETVEHYLTTSTQGGVIDGDSIANMSSFKIMSPLFTMSANADLANCFDDCINGTEQSFVAGGYFFMLKPLSPGTHTIHRVGGASSLFPFLYDITYNITQQ
jgi:hypothetical protein